MTTMFSLLAQPNLAKFLNAYLSHQCALIQPHVELLVENVFEGI